MQMPIFPDGYFALTPELGVQSRDGSVHYFNGHLPVFSHAVDDTQSFRFWMSTLIENGTVSQGQVSRAFGVPRITIKRACKTLRTLGPSGFFAPKPPATGHRLTPERIAQAQALLDQGCAVPAIGKTLGVFSNALNKAISAGRFKKSQRC